MLLLQLKEERMSSTWPAKQERAKRKKDIFRNSILLKPNKYTPSKSKTKEKGYEDIVSTVPSVVESSFQLKVKFGQLRCRRQSIMVCHHRTPWTVLPCQRATEL